MLSLRYRFIYLLLSTIKYAASHTTQFYWKTTTDSAVDYWNHGPIFVPGLQGIYTMTTKTIGIFPPWLTRTTAKGSGTKITPITRRPTTTKPTTVKTTTEEPTTEEPTTEEPTTEEPTTEEPTTEEPTTEEPTIEEPTTTKPTTSKMKRVPMPTRKTRTLLTKSSTHIKEASKTTLNFVFRHHETKPPSQSVIDEESVMQSPVYYDENYTKQTKIKFKSKTTITTTKNIEDVEPFSLFLRSLLKMVCVKALPDLFDLVNAFSGYVTTLMGGGKLTMLGPDTTSFIKKSIQDIRNLGPEDLRTQCGIAHTMLLRRHYLLSSSTNKVLDYMDDTYAEAEEEAMQEVLRDASAYPSTQRRAEDIARNFVDEVFLIPLNRVAGTAAGDFLFKMITKTIQLMSSNTRTYRKRHVFDGSREGIRLRSQDHVKKNKSKRSNYNELNYLLPKKKHSKGHRHKHGHDPRRSHKSKCKKLKRKYNRLKKLIKNGTSATFEKHITSSTVTDKVTMKPYEINETIFRNGLINYQKIDQNYDFSNLNATTEKEKENIILNNVFNAYDYADDINFRRNELNNNNILADIHREDNSKLYNTINEDVSYYHESYEDFYPSPNTASANIFNTTEDTDVEIELKRSLYDAFRHMDFINTTVRRNIRHDLIPKHKLQSDSIETDAEAVLKNNIYKVMRNN